MKVGDGEGEAKGAVVVKGCRRGWRWRRLRLYSEKRRW